MILSLNITVKSWNLVNVTTGETLYLNIPRAFKIMLTNILECGNRNVWQWRGIVECCHIYKSH